MTTPEPTPADRAAAAAFTLASGEWIQEDLLAEHFAAWRVKCVANEHRLRNALSELHAIVRGECPSLLNEDSGGSAELAIEIEELLTTEARNDQ